MTMRPVYTSYGNRKSKLKSAFGTAAMEWNDPNFEYDEGTGKARLQGTVDSWIARHQSIFEFPVYRWYSLSEELAGIHC